VNAGPGRLPAAPDEALPADAVEVGRILGAWGVKGGIRLKPHAAHPQALFSSKRWYLQPPDVPRPAGPRAAPPLPPLLRVVQAREHGEGVVATVHDIDERAAAQALSGARIFVRRASFPTPDEGEFYAVDLEGCRAETVDGDVIGTVKHLTTYPTCDVLVISKLEGEGTLEVPLTDAFVDEVDVDAHVVRLKTIEGL